VKLSIVANAGQNVVTAEITYRYVKNHRQKEPFRSTLIEDPKDYGYGLCPITLLLALAFADDAFEAVRTPAELFVKKASNEGILHLRWKRSVLSQPLLRQIVRGEGRAVSAERGLRYDVLRPHIAGIIQRAGFEEDFSLYSIRRGTANITEGKIPAARHRQMMGHQQPKTFERNYIAYTSFLDIEALSQDQPERLDLLRSLARSSSRRDVNAPNELPAEEVAKVYQSEELKEFDEDLRAALDAQDHAAADQVKDARRYKMRKLLADRLKSYRKSWFEQRDGENGRINNDRYVLEIPPHDLEMERRRAAAALFSSIQSDNQVTLVEDLATICPGKSATIIGKSNTRTPAKYTENQFFRGADPSNGHCLFCNSDLSSMNHLHQVTHANQCFSRHHQI